MTPLWQSCLQRIKCRAEAENWLDYPYALYGIKKFSYPSRYIWSLECQYIWFHCIAQFSDVAVSAPIKVAFMPTFSSSARFCFPRTLRGVIIIWMWPAGKKRSGIQKVSVFLMPMPAMIMTSWSCFNTASTALACQWVATEGGLSKQVGFW